MKTEAEVRRALYLVEYSKKEISESGDAARFVVLPRIQIYENLMLWVLGLDRLTDDFFAGLEAKISEIERIEAEQKAAAHE